MLTLKEIEKARKAIAGSIYLSPLAYSETLSNQTGYKVHLKLENLQMTGSFKERGALNRVLNLYEEEKSTGVIAASAGNHARGVARPFRDHRPDAGQYHGDASRPGVLEFADRHGQRGINPGDPRAGPYTGDHAGAIEGRIPGKRADVKAFIAGIARRARDFGF